MKKVFVLALLMALPAMAQSVRWQTFEQSIDSTATDSTWFSLRTGIFGRDVEPDSAAILPSANAVIDETPVATFRQISGTAADSSITYAKPIVVIDGVAYVVQNDSVFVFGASLAAPASPNTFGDGNLYAKTLSFATKRFQGVLFITAVFDTETGVRKFEWGLGTK